MRNCATFSARLLGGQLLATATVHDVTGKQQGHVVAALRRISLADLKRIANSVRLKPVAISGYVNANADASWTGNMNNLFSQGRCDRQRPRSPPRRKAPTNASFR